MTAKFQSFELQQGQNVELQVTVTDSDSVAVDLTGSSIRFAMARTESSAILVDSTASPQTATTSITSASAGQFSVYIDDAILDDFLGDYFYEMKVTDLSGNETIVTKGIMTFLPALT